MLSITYGISKVASYHVVLLVLARFGLLVVSGLSSKGRFLVVPASYSISPLYLSTIIPRCQSAPPLITTKRESKSYSLFNFKRMRRGMSIQLFQASWEHPSILFYSFKGRRPIHRKDLPWIRKQSEWWKSNYSSVECTWKIEENVTQRKKQIVTKRFSRPTNNGSRGWP